MSGAGTASGPEGVDYVWFLTIKGHICFIGVSNAARRNPWLLYFLRRGTTSQNSPEQGAQGIGTTILTGPSAVWKLVTAPSSPPLPKKKPNTQFQNGRQEEVIVRAHMDSNNFAVISTGNKHRTVS